MSVFAIRDYRRLFSAQIIALFGTGLAGLAAVARRRKTQA